LLRRNTARASKKSSADMTPAMIGEATQAKANLETMPGSVGWPMKMFQPMMPPTIAWLVETGRPRLVIR